MDRSERSPDVVDTLIKVLTAHQSTIWTAMPGKVAAVRLDDGVVDVWPVIQAQVRLPGPDGEVTWVDLPMLRNCPICFQGGGPFQLTFPVAVDDECLVVFSSRMVDAWWTSGNRSNIQPELRMHDLSDGFAIVGVRSLPRKLAAVSTTAVQLRHEDGTTRIAIKSNKEIELVSPVKVVITSPLADFSGDIHAAGTITSDTDVVGDGISLHDHLTSGVDPGTGTSGPPI